MTDPTTVTRPVPWTADGLAGLAAEGLARRLAIEFAGAELAAAATLDEDARRALLGARLQSLLAYGVLRPDETAAIDAAVSGADVGPAAPGTVAGTVRAAVAGAGAVDSGAGPIGTALAAVGGAAIGYMAGGPPGALIGAGAGALVAQAGL